MCVPNVQINKRPILSRVNYTVQMCLCDAWHAEGRPAAGTQLAAAEATDDVEVVMVDRMMRLVRLVRTCKVIV